MVYINRGTDNVVVTDSVINYIPKTLYILFDDKILGSYKNVSTDKNYFKFTLPSSIIDNVTIGEHMMIINYYGKILKQELVLVDSLTTTPIIEKSKEKIVINYEKK